MLAAMRTLRTNGDAAAERRIMRGNSSTVGSSVGE
jgi:hypothetical protein